MNRDLTQKDLFTTHEPVIHCLDGALLTEILNVFDITERNRLFVQLRDEIRWQQATIRIAGNTLPIPRLQCWIGDEGLNYSYSGMALRPARWTSTLLTIKHRVEQLAEQEFNAVLANLYRNGNDSVAWHSDDEPELGPDPVVASVSLGAERPFELKPKHEKNQRKLRIVLRDGSVLIMGKGCQNNWMHQLPKVKELAEPRINLTFRTIKR